MLLIRPATRIDADAWLTMRQDLWPDGGLDGHAEEIERFFQDQRINPLEVLIALDSVGPVGFAELSIRFYAEGCDTDRVAFLEGWYVTPECRRRGIGKALILASEDWGRSQGCTEFASDALLDNVVSARAHLALGFEEAAQLRCFRKNL